MANNRRILKKDHKDLLFSALNQQQGIAQQLQDELGKRKKAEEKLKESEERFRHFFENQPEYCYVISPKGKIRDINRSALNALGYKKSEILEKRVLAVYADSSREKARDLLMRWKKTGKLRNEELNIITKDGKERTVLLSVDAVRDAKGEIMHSLSVQRDITELKKASQALQENKEKAEQYLKIAGVMLATVGIGEKITLINKKGCQLLGYDEKEIIGKNWFDLLVPKDVRKDVRAVFNKLMAGKVKLVEFYENLLLTKKGDERLFAFHNTILTDRKGKIIGVLFSADDITEKKKAEKELVKSRSELRSVNKKLNEYAIKLNKKIERIDDVRIPLTGKEKLGFYGLVNYPTLSMEDIAKKLNMKRVTLNTIKNRLSNEGYFSGKYFPRYDRIGYSMLNINYFDIKAKGGKIAELANSINNVPEIIYSIATDKIILCISFTRDWSDYKKMENTLSGLMEELQVKCDKSKTINFAADQGRFLKYFDFSSILRCRFKLKITSAGKKALKFTSCKINDTERKLISCMLNHPKFHIHQLAQKVKLSVPTVVKYREKLLNEGIIRYINLLDLTKIGTELIVLRHSFQSSTARNDNAFLSFSTKSEQFSLSVYKDYSEYYNSHKGMSQPTCSEIIIPMKNIISLKEDAISLFEKEINS